MKKKFNLLTLLIFLFIIPFQAQALDSRCSSLFKSIENNELNLQIDELDYYKTKHPNFVFETFYNLKNDKWEYVRDSENNLIIGNIFDTDEEELIIGDKLLSINDEKISKMNEAQIDEFFENYDTLKLELKNNKGIKVLKEYGFVDFKAQAEAVVDVKVKSISDIDVKGNTFNGDLTLSVTWQNENLHSLSKEHLIVDKENDEYWYCKFTPKEFEKMQIGEVFFETVNSVKQNENLINDEYKFNISDYLYSIEAYKKEERNFVEITHDKKGNFTFSNEYNLKAFPFDRQILKIKIADLSRSIDMLNLNVDNFTIIGLQNFKINGKILEWKIIDAYTNYYHEKDLVYSYPSSGVELVFEIERNFQYYIFKVIFPIILILLVSWSVFWVHPKELESKLTITIVCLLSLIAYNFVIDKDLPKLSYLTILDYIVLLSYVFATIPNFISIYSFEKHRKRQPIWQIVDRKSRIYGPVIYLVLVLAIIIINATGNEHTSAFLGFLR